MSHGYPEHDLTCGCHLCVPPPPWEPPPVIDPNQRPANYAEPAAETPMSRDDLHTSDCCCIKCLSRREYVAASNERRALRAAVAETPAPGALPVHEFSTGAVRSKDADDVRYDLITPIGLAAVARAYAEGAVKYADFNWEKGMPVNQILNHAIRHIYLFLEGDRSEDHLGHAGWNVLAAIHSDTLWPELNAGALRRPGCQPPTGEAAR